MTTQRSINLSRQAAERQAKLDRIREQVASGELRIRQATAAELRRWREQRDGAPAEPVENSTLT